MSAGNPRRCSRSAPPMLIQCANRERECILTGQREINLASADNRGGTFAGSPCFFLSAELFETSGNSCLPPIDLPLPGSLCGKHIDPWLLLVPLITDGLCHCQALIWCRAVSPCNGMRGLKQPSDTISCKHGRLPLIITSSCANIQVVKALFLRLGSCIQDSEWKKNQSDQSNNHTFSYSFSESLWTLIQPFHFGVKPVIFWKPRLLIILNK